MIDSRTQRRPSGAAIRRTAATLLLTALLGLVSVATTLASSVPPAISATATTPAATTTANAMAADILGWLNRDRAAIGLRPLRAWTPMTTLANHRSSNLAASHVLSHVAAGGDPGRALIANGLGWYSFGENIGETSYPWGSQAARSLYSMWKSSPAHHAIMFSASYNYVGVGIARASDGSTWSSVLFTESPDHTPPSARNGALSRIGTTVRFSWTGSDVRLQTHTAGLRSFDVQYRVDGGPWHLLRNDTKATSLTLWGRARHHYYSFRVQSADRRGNLSAWTPAKRIWVP